MGRGILVDTEKVKGTATKIKKVNSELTSSFNSNVEGKIKRLQNNWEGQAANLIIGHFYSIKSEMLNAREIELHNYELILRNIIGEGYEKTEITNTKLSSLFK